MKPKELVDLVEKYIVAPSDINSHLSTLMELAEGLDVVEFGVRNGISTAALLLASKTFTAYDIEPRQTGLEKYGLNFICADDLEIEPVRCDMLFIDTHHSYPQLLAELTKHAGAVKKHIAIHDTFSVFAYNDQKIPEGKISKLPPARSDKKGLVDAILDFMCSEAGRDWCIVKEYPYCNGLTIMGRI